MRTNQTRRTTNSTRTLLISLPIVALLAWGGLLLFTRYVPPESVFAFCIFFTLLGIALFGTLTPLIYLITRGALARRIAHPTMNHALRQAILISSFLIFNLVLRVLHSWNLFTAAVSFGIIVVIELLALGGK